ncbi:hypothetical protein DN586_16420 [Enterobacter cloacae]|nr:hypothetical protein DN586_16420 [Enterobacter cloacae]
MVGDSKYRQPLAPLIFLCLYLLLSGLSPRFTQPIWWLLNQSPFRSEETVSNRVIIGKSHLAITRRAVE